jgi:hypothetical protein
VIVPVGRKAWFWQEWEDGRNGGTVWVVGWRVIVIVLYLMVHVIALSARLERISRVAK